MKTTALLSASAICLLLGACSGIMPQRAEDLPYRTGTIDRAADGTVQRALLVEPRTISGVACRGWVSLHPGGALKSGDLAADTTIVGHALPKGSRVFLRPDGSLEHCWLSQDTDIDGAPCAGGVSKIDTTFHDNGRRKAAFLSRDCTIQAVECKASLYTPLRFDASGGLLKSER